MSQPTTEDQRLAVLRSYEVLDTPAEAAFDAITRVAAHVADAPIALVSLIDERRQWFKSRHGLDVAQTPRDQAFCAHTIAGGGTMIVPDASLDPRFRHNPLVTGEPRIAFYAGVPVSSPEGARLGTLCVIDRRPRELSATQVGLLEQLARHVEAELELRRVGKMHAREHARLLLKERELEEAHAQLERRVAERTAELRESHARLLREVRERHLAEDELRTARAQFHQAQRLEALGRLAGGVAHDFNNLLTVVLGYSSSLRSDETLEADARSKVEQIEAAGRRAAALTKQLLAIGRRQVLQPRVIDANTAARRLRKMLARVIGVDVELRLELEDGLPPIEVDPAQLEQVLMNLAINARDAMPGGGVLTLGTRSLDDGGPSTRGRLAGPVVVLSVSDTGTGMSEETAEKIFEPFFTSKPEGEGTGLGLSTVIGIVEQSGGVVDVETALGVGSTFRVTFPVAVGAARPPTSAPPAPLAAGRGEGETILVVDDDAPVRRLLTSLLRGNGYAVVEASGPGDALLLAETQLDDIDLVLCDVSMPRMSGPALLERLRRDRPELRALLISGAHAGAPSEEPRLLKPVTLPALLGAVREALAR